MDMGKPWKSLVYRAGSIVGWQPHLPCSEISSMYLCWCWAVFHTLLLTNEFFKDTKASLFLGDAGLLLWRTLMNFLKTTLQSKTSISQQIKSQFLATAHPRDVVGCQLHEPQLKPLKTLTKCTDFYGWKSRDCKGCRADQFWLDALWFSGIYPPLPICSVLRMTAWWLWVPALHLQKRVARGRHGD